MSNSRQPASIRRLNFILGIASLMALITAVLLIYLASSIIYHRPLHPIAAAAEKGTPAEPSEALTDVQPPVTGLVAVAPRLQHEAAELLPGAQTSLDAPERSSSFIDPARQTRPPEPAQGAGESERITILVMGTDGRLGYSSISRTDVMMLVSVNLSQEKISLLSIPRDLYVDIPGYGRDRINTAFVHGSASDNPAGGATLAMQTVENTLGVSIDHYVVVDFNAIVRTVDLLGGIDIYVPYTIDDPTYPDMFYGYDPLYIPEGLHHFDGNMTLKYARTRHQDNDFYRAQRQQQILFALRQKILNMGAMELLDQVPALYERVRSGVFTDLSLAQIVRLAQVAGDIPEENIETEVLDYDYVLDYRSSSGASVLVLVRMKAEPLIQRLFYDE